MFNYFSLFFTYDIKEVEIEKRDGYDENGNDDIYYIYMDNGVCDYIVVSGDCGDDKYKFIFYLFGDNGE